MTKPKAIEGKIMSERTLPELTVVVPCYNERENVRPLVALLDKALTGIQWEVLFVDDDSPDGTAAEVHALARQDVRVRLLHRIGRRGLAGACIEGILSAISPLVAVMDGDLQHDETKLAEMVAAFAANPALDLAIGSRFVDGGSATGGLSAIRATGSNLATNLARRFLKITARDPMSGFFMIRRERFNEVVLGLQTQGFKILADMLAASKGRWSVAEIGYEFRNRQFGESKMDAAVTLEFLGLIATRMMGGIFPIRFILFAAVGVSGVFVQLLAVKFAFMMGVSAFFIAQSFGVWVAMTTNYFVNNALTYRDRALKGRALIFGLFSFYAVCLIGAIANVAVADWVLLGIGNWQMASVIGALVGAMWNFGASSLVTWRVK